MSKIVKFVLANPARKFVGTGVKYPETPADEVLKAEMQALLDMQSELFDARSERSFSGLEQRAAPLCGDYANDLRTEIERDLRPATCDEINKLIFMLIDSRRDSRELSPTFAEMAVARVSALLPSYGALQDAVKMLIDEPREDFKAKMEIADIREAVKTAQRLRERALEQLTNLPVRIAERRAELDKTAIERMSRRDRMKAHIREIIRDEGRELEIAKRCDAEGVEAPPSAAARLSRYDADLVAEVRAEMVAVAPT